MAMLKVRGLILGLMLLAGVPALAQGVNPAAVAGLEGQHPVEYFRRAADLFKTGQKDDAVFAFFYGQLRYRTFLAARPDLPKDRDPALFAALMNDVGTPINHYAFGDIPRLARCIDAVLVHARRIRDTLTPPEKAAKVHASVRAGLVQMKQAMLKGREQIKAERVKNGLENRS